jgi:hypothetical protein
MAGKVLAGVWSEERVLAVDAGRRRRVNRAVEVERRNDEVRKLRASGDRHAARERDLHVRELFARAHEHDLRSLERAAVVVRGRVNAAGPGAERGLVKQRSRYKVAFFALGWLILGGPRSRSWSAADSPACTARSTSVSAGDVCDHQRRADERTFVRRIG